MEQPSIDLTRSAMVFNDMVNANIRPEHDPARFGLVEESGLIDRTIEWVADLRRLAVPIFWVRVERRADQKDRRLVLTDALIKAGGVRPAPHVKGSFASQNIAELPIHTDDHEILKPRFSPLAGTDLDLQLRTRGIDTILLGGISTHMGVESCARNGFDLDYNVVVVRDVCWAADQKLHEWSLTQHLPNFGRVLTRAQVLDLAS